MSENGNIDEEWLEKTGRGPKPEGEFIPADPDTIDVKDFKKWLGMSAGPDQATNREYFCDKGYDTETVMGFYFSYKERRDARMERKRTAQPIPWMR